MARGAGATGTCGQYLAEVANKSDLGNSLQQWALGYVTGYMATASSDPTAKMTNIEVLRALQTYCGTHPTSRFVDALTVFTYAASIANKKNDPLRH